MNQTDISVSTLSLDNGWEQATGPVAIPMTNDYLFRALLQRNNHVLKSLICSLLHLKSEDVSSVTIANPIELGASMDTKTFILDIKVELNENTLINLEMQVINERNWPERSLGYLCRSFDNLNRGDDYLDVKPAIQIGILDFTLFKDQPEFYATYKLMNTKNHRIYSDKLCLSVLDLTKTELATEEDKRHHIHHWAALFKSTTWEELKMLANSDDYIKEAASTVYQLSQEEKIRQQCEMREEYIRRENTRIRYAEQCEERARQAIAATQQALAETERISAMNEKMAAENEKIAAENEKIAAENERLRKILAEHGINA